MPPIRSPTNNGTYIVQLDWKPSSLGLENDSTFTISFFDKSGARVNGVVNYDFVAAGFDLSPIAEYYNQTTDQSGLGRPIVIRFQNASAIEITVWVNSPNPTGTFESATFDIMVTPEFPTTSILLAVSMMAVLVLGAISWQKVKDHSRSV